MDKKLKGLSKYTFDMVDGRIVVKNHRGSILKGYMIPGYKKYYTLMDDNRKKRYYGEHILAFYYKNPHLPALCNKFMDKGVFLTIDGKIRTEVHRARQYNVFSGIDEALETVLLVKAYQQGDVSPILMWLAEVREKAVYTVTRFGKCSFSKARYCLDAADVRFWSQLETFNVQKIMPLFAMYCKCLRQEIMSARTVPVSFEKKYINER